MLIKAAINGGRTKAENPSIPISPDEIAIATAECLNAGAGAIHFHVRSSTGRESLTAEDVARTLNAVRLSAPKAQVGVSTGAWIVPDPSMRLKIVTGWSELPDFASVNFHEKGVVELAQRLLSKGVGVEAGLCDALAAENLVNSGLAKHCIRVLLEPQEQEIEKARETVREIKAVLDRVGIEIPRLLHGTEATTWEIMGDAINEGYDIRIGFEDTLIFSDGMLARSNVDLVTEAKQRVARGAAV